jgi:hypothetical protein
VDPTWESCPRGINVGGWGLKIKVEDIARFGQLYLQKGLWHGKRLLTEAWVAEATAWQVANEHKTNADWRQGYGYQFWRCQHGAYRGDGAFGQYCVVMPEQDAVLAINSGVKDMQAPLDLVWEHLLPAMQAAALPADSAAQAGLAQKLAALALPPLAGEPTSATAARVTGKGYDLAANRLGMTHISFEISGENCSYTMASAEGALTVTAGFGRWLPGSALLPGRGMQPVSASVAWTEPDTLVFSQRHVETPFTYTLSCKFGRSRVTVTPAVNLSMGPEKLPVLHGKLA